MGAIILVVRTTVFPIPIHRDVYWKSNFLIENETQWRKSENENTLQ